MQPASAIDIKVKGQMALTVGALGVVFGDIGTSPLYALKECFSPAYGLTLNHDNVIGILSLIFWSMTLIISVKYMAFVMRADNRGEGGIMALLALALRAQYRHTWLRPVIIGFGLFGAALFFGDGMITPAISVVSAVEGLEVAAPGLKPFIIPISIGVLIGLFMLQRRGTGSVGSLFGPVMVVWFSVLAVLGVTNIWKSPEVLELMDPSWALLFIRENPLASFIALGAVILTITGAESIYADMGHFGRSPIRKAWFFMAFPALMLNYSGQGALLLIDPSAVENPFYRMVPTWGLYPLIGLATVAAVIASQAVITGVFSIARQAMLLGYLPRFQINHTSESQLGQIYIPFFNWTLLIAIILLVLTFQNSSNLAAVYGIAITMTMICDAVLLLVVAHKIWGWKPWAAAAMVMPLLLIELIFFSATTLKIIAGGWFPLFVGSISFLIMLTWKRGRELLGKRLGAETMPLNLFINSIGGNADQTVPGTAVFMTTSHHHVPHALLHNMKHNKVIHERNVMLTLVIQDVPYLRDDERLRIEKVAHQFYLMTASYGFKEQPDIPELLNLSSKQGLDFDMMDTSFFVARERLVPTPQHGMFYWQQKLFMIMARNAVPATDFFNIPTNRVVEMGTQVRL